MMTVTQALPRDKQWEVTGPDATLMLLFSSLLLYGIIMVFSTTVSQDQQLVESNFQHLISQSLHIAIGIFLCFIFTFIPLRFWQRSSKWLLIMGLLCLLLVLIPGIGHQVNGSQRWLMMGPLRIQPSELMKFIMVIYTADFLVRKSPVITHFKKTVIPLIFIIVIMASLILLEPDLGTTFVITTTVVAMMFLGGIRVMHFLACLFAGSIVLVALMITSPYRMQRILGFIDPFADPYNSGFQLVQALIAIGRGEWFGVGIGKSIQKLFYLPHAHNDFILAVIGEELGFIGISVVIILFLLLMLKIFSLANLAERSGRLFECKVAQGIGLIISIQALIHIGVNLGVLPTKGLTLPFMSYGGSSLIVNSMLMGVVFAIDREVRQKPGGET